MYKTAGYWTFMIKIMSANCNLQTRLKVQLKLSISRLRSLQQKAEAQAKQQRRQMAEILSNGKIESARIRTENIIRDDLTLELYEILELYCELLLARSQLFDQPTCDEGLEEAVKAILYAAPKTQVKELQLVRQLLAEKFGKEFTLDAAENRTGKVPERVLKKLRLEPPSNDLVDKYLALIAEAYRVDWPPGSHKAAAEAAAAAAAAAAADTADDEDDDDDVGGGSKEKPLENKDRESTLAQESADLAEATPPRGDVGARSPISVNPPGPTTDNISPHLNIPDTPSKPPGKVSAPIKKVKPPAAPSASASTSAPPAAAAPKKKAAVPGKIPTLDDELMKRFAELKRP
jgi:vacuolar protein sorting-associated protein IST1